MILKKNEATTLAYNTHRQLPSGYTLDVKICNVDLAELATVQMSVNSNDNRVVTASYTPTVTGKFYLLIEGTYTEFEVVDKLDSELIGDVKTKVDDTNTKVGNVLTSNVDVAYSYLTTQDTTAGKVLDYVPNGNYNYVDSRVVISLSSTSILVYITAQTNNTITISKDIEAIPAGTKINILNSNIKETVDILKAVNQSSLFIPSDTSVSS